MDEGVIARLLDPQRRNLKGSLQIVDAGDSARDGRAEDGRKRLEHRIRLSAFFHMTVNDIDEIRDQSLDAPLKIITHWKSRFHR